MRYRLWLVKLIAGSALLLFPPNLAFADELYGRIRGTVTDPSGAAMVGVQVTATNVATGVSKTVTSGADGSYEVIQLPAPATYNVSARQSGFKSFAATNIPLFLNQIYVLDIKMELGAFAQKVVIRAAVAQVETSSMQLGADITGSVVVDLPLNGRNWVQLQQTLPGAMAPSDYVGGSGAVSMNGSRTQANGYLINGADANQFGWIMPAEIPSPDAIGEVHIVTNAINPEFGRSSGAILNAVTKSGTNAFHGTGFEFYRDTSLNTRDFFYLTPTVFHQNQFGGTIGGPIRKNKTFFFYSYQGTRAKQPEGGGTVTVFTPDQRNGIFTDVAASSNSSPFPLVGENGTEYPARTPYSTIFPTGHIPATDVNPISLKLMNTYVPLPNLGKTDFTFDPVTVSTFDQSMVRVDHNFTERDQLFGYWFWQRSPSTDTLAAPGATLPGFADYGHRDPQHWALDWNHTFSGNMLNEVRFAYNRVNALIRYPVKPTLPASFGFTGINPQSSEAAGLPVIPVIGYFTLGASVVPLTKLEQTYQVTDNFAWIKGHHSLKFGFAWHFAKDNSYTPAYDSGQFGFGGSGTYTTGDPGADFLLGIPDFYMQFSGILDVIRTQEYYSFAQDLFKIRPSLTLTYGLAWQVDTPLTNAPNNQLGVAAFRPGQQSQVFPTAPAGMVFPGDAGITASGYKTRYGHFGPRLGFAWSPGSARKWALRGGWGYYYSISESEVPEQEGGSPPFMLLDLGIGDAGGSPAFATPFTDITGSFSIPNKYPFHVPSRGSPVNFGVYEPSALGTVDPGFTTQQSMNYNLTLERQLPGDAILAVAYVGLQGRHLELVRELNPAGQAPGVNPACAALFPSCNAYSVAFVAPQSFRYNPTIFGSIGQMSTDANSNYNSLQVSYNKHFSHGLQMIAAWTYSHSLDDASDFEGSWHNVNPFSNSYSYGDSSFDARQRFVISYDYQLPSLRRLNAFHAFPSRLTDGWQIAGISTFQTGFPITLSDSSYRSLICNAAYAFFGCPDRPNIVGPVRLVNPRSSAFVNKVLDPSATSSLDHYYFDPNSFTRETPGILGNAGRNFFHGPGINNFDFGLYKNTRLTERTTLQARFEFYNLFNHPQFQNPIADVNSGDFGRTLSTTGSRVIQLAAKIIF